ncbi:multidrug efflux MFS transporter [Actinoplanes sp. LDG1-06]|uniref:Multidrug efflux MFS transporter n=1 Tax=Paractinoplanes ovalisporus TaxID=2810368 RepID=A0ABS2A7E1_9ACTN|nr:MDR family MFS transporter [Actinoplanes ovalisporus]MBM2615759.1 multidrug efflux MFS transporter [Actinoplanes ovalisporus]
MRRTAVVVASGAIMTVLDTTIVNVAVHVLGRDLGVSLATTQWVLTAYLLALSTTIPLTGWAARRFGTRTVWLTSLVLFTAGSLLCAAAWSAGSLIAFRVLQGVGGGLLMPTGQTMLARAAGPERMARAMAVVSVPAMLAPALGPVLGGVLLDHLSWRWMFGINVPICAVALVLAFRLLPAGAGDRERTGLDVPGLLTLAPGVAAVVLGLTWISDGRRPAGLATLAAGVVLLGGFAWHARRRGDRALVDLRLFTDRAFATSVGVLFGYSVAMFGVLILIPLFVQQVRGGDTLDAGLMVAPLGAGAIVTMALAGRVTDRFGTRAPAVAGLLLVLGGLIPYGETELMPLAAAAFVIGLGHGLITPVVMAGAYRTLPPPAIPGATTAATILIRVGSALGAAILAIVLQTLLRDRAPADAFELSFWWTFAIVGAALIPALTLAGRPVRVEAHTQAAMR